MSEPLCSSLKGERVHFRGTNEIDLSFPVHIEAENIDGQTVQNKELEKTCPCDIG